jgi:putative membrane protein
MQMTRWIYITTFVALGVFACDDDDAEDRPDLAEADRSFVESTALGNLTEVEFGNLAVSKGMDSLARAYGQHMIDEHSTAQAELERIGDKFDNVEWPEEMDAQHEQMHDSLEQTSGHQFDTTYMASQIKDHQATLALFDMQIANGTDAEVKAYAQKYRPRIQMHLDLANSVRTQLQANNETDGEAGNGDGTGDGDGDTEGDGT